MRDQRGTRFESTARDHVEHARREEVRDELRQPQCRQRRLFRRLDDEGVAGGERRSGLSRRKHEGMIEGDDSGHDTKRFANGDVHPVGPHRNGSPVHFRHQAGEEIDLRRRDLRVCHHGANGIAAVDRVEQRELHAAFARTTAANRRSAAARSSGGTSRHNGNAACALATAAPHVGRRSVGGVAERLTRPGTRQFEEISGERAMPRAAVIEVAMGGETGQSLRPKHVAPWEGKGSVEESRCTIWGNA